MYDMLCAGCGHRTAMMLLDDIINEMHLKEKVILALDVACCSLLIDYVDYDAIMCAHGRVLDVTKGYKSIRKDNVVISYIGDGAAYSIGIEEIVHSARRNDDTFIVVINNGLYSMTGGQISPTYIDNNIEASNGFLIENVIGNFPIKYLSRGAVTDSDNIKISRKYLKKALSNYINSGGFNIVELLSPCPTNYKLSPKDMTDKINNEFTKIYKIGEIIG